MKLVVGVVVVEEESDSISLVKSTLSGSPQAESSSPELPEVEGVGCRV